jgi:Fur family peroxide stress response transcriptional regulator
MADPTARFEQLIAALKERNFRLTPQRIELVRLIAVSEGHPSANQFYKRVKRKFPTMSHATVYKTLALLKDMNQVLEIELREDSHYDGNRPQPHPHLICMKCGQIADGDLSLEQAALRKLEDVSGYTILRPQISLYGLCPDCREES